MNFSTEIDAFDFKKYIFLYTLCTLQLDSIVLGGVP